MYEAGLAVGAVIVVVPVVLALCNRWLGAWACRVMGWHLEPGRKWYNGLNRTGDCPRCGEHVMQDSQGNWF